MLPLVAISLSATLAWQPSPCTTFRAQSSLKSRTVVQMKDFVQSGNNWNTMNKMKTVKPGQKPRARPKKLPADVMEITSNFKKEYPRKDLELLWGALLVCYGNAELAKAAVVSNPQIINPSYSFCNTMITSKEVLFGMMGEEEAIEVMTKNPAVLQCGPSLDTLGPDEIKGFANIRYWGTRLFPENARLPLLGFLLAVCIFPIFAVRIPALEDTMLLNIVKPLVGILFAVAIEGSRIAIVGTIVKAKMSGDERIEKAQENERRRMGKGPKVGARQAR